jgi:hypothetical protein
LDKQELRRRVFRFTEEHKAARPDVAAYVMGAFLCFFDDIGRQEVERGESEESTVALWCALRAGACQLCGGGAPGGPHHAGEKSATAPNESAVGIYDQPLYDEVANLLQDILEV